MAVFKKILLILMLISALTIGAVGCDTDEGTIGDTGEEIGEGIGDTGEEVGEGIGEAGEEVGETVE